MSLTISFMFPSPLLFAQDTKKQQEDGTVHIRIEKYKDGEKEVIERTYKAGEEPDYFGDKAFSFNNTDILFHRLNSDVKFSSDTLMFRGPAQVFKYLGPDSTFAKDNFIFRSDFDSLLANAPKMVFKFDSHSNPERMDSLLQNQFNEGQRVIMKFNGLQKSMPLDSIMQSHKNLNENFIFNWNDNKRFDFHLQGLHLLLEKDAYYVREESVKGRKKVKITSKNNNDLDLSFDKEVYQIDEVETSNGKKMIKITPIKESKEKETRNSKNFRKSLQLSAANLNLYPNPANGIITVELNLPASNTTTITVVNPQGKEIYREKLKNFERNYIRRIDLSKEGSGVFVVRVDQQDQTISKKVVIQ